MQYSDFQFLRFEHQPNGVLVITIDRPEVMNATHAGPHRDLAKVWAVVDEDPATQVKPLMRVAAVRDKRAPDFTSARR